MKTFAFALARYSATGAALLVLALLFSVGCDSDSSPSEPSVSVDFDCFLLTEDSIECSGVISGGKAPFHYKWTATSQRSSSGLDASTVVFRYNRICSSAIEAVSITVSMTITDDGGNGEARGPVSKGYRVCESSSEDSVWMDGHGEIILEKDSNKMIPTFEDFQNTEPLFSEAMLAPQ